MGESFQEVKTSEQTRSRKDNILANNEIKNKLFSVGDKIKVKYRETFDEIKKPYVDAVLDSVPAHMRKIKEYEL